MRLCPCVTKPRYTLFAWGWARNHGWVVYPFLDYTLPLRKGLPCHLGLVALLGLFYVLGMVLTSALGHLPPAARFAGHCALMYSVILLRTPKEA